MHDTLVDVLIKKPFGAGTKRYAAQLALALVCYFYLLKTFIFWSNEAHTLKVRYLWHILFNKIFSCKIFMSIRREAIVRYFLLGLMTHYCEF